MSLLNSLANIVHSVANEIGGGHSGGTGRNVPHAPNQPLQTITSQPLPAPGPGLSNQGNHSGAGTYVAPSSQVPRQALPNHLPLLQALAQLQHLQVRHSNMPGLLGSGYQADVPQGNNFNPGYTPLQQNQLGSSRQTQITPPNWQLQGQRIPPNIQGPRPIY